MNKYLSTIILGPTLLIVSLYSLFVGVMDIDLNALISGGNGMELLWRITRNRILLIADILLIAVTYAVASFLGKMDVGDELAQREFHVNILKIVLSCTMNGNELAVTICPLGRNGNFLNS